MKAGLKVFFSPVACAVTLAANRDDEGGQSTRSSVIDEVSVGLGGRIPRMTRLGVPTAAVGMGVDIWCWGR